MTSGQRGTAKGIRVGSLTACILAVAIVVLAPLCLFGQSGGCTAGAPVRNFYIDQNGNVTSTGRSSEGPACVEVHFNAFRFDVSVTLNTSITAGPNLQSVTGSGPTAQTGAEKADELAKLQNELTRLDKAASEEANGVKDLTALLAFVDLNIGPGKAFPEAEIKQQYAGLKKALLDSETLQFNFLPTDLASGVCPSTPAATPAPGSILAKLQGYQGDTTFYTGPAKAAVDAALGLANLYKCGPNVTTVENNIAILKWWDGRFQGFGLRSDSKGDPLQVNLGPFFVNSNPLSCGNIFNQSSSTTASVTLYDWSQTLTGTFAKPAAHQDQNFFALTCASPFTISAGVEFSTIPSREFGIIKSAGGPNNTSINTFGLTSDSAFHPLPIALAHARLWESPSHKLAAHATAGASGNIQGQNSGGSSAEFLIGGSLSFFRTMFISLGLHVGTESTLAGGFKVGQTVPTDISSVQVSKSYTKGVGIAITFTKP